MQIYTRKKVTAFLLGSIFLLLGSLSGCKSSAPATTASSQFIFDTIVQIEITDSDADEVLNRVFELCRSYENMLSRTKEGSDIYKINHAGGEPVTVSEETAALIQKGIDYSRISDGAFDITIAPLSSLWNFKNNTKIPPESEITEAVSHVDYHLIQLDGNTVTLTDPKAQIDLGGIAKGYVADKVKEYLLSQNIKYALINLGGNMLTLGSKPDGSPYHIGIQKPFAAAGTAITSVNSSGQSVVSSGVYERYFEADGKRYHHILNPRTGYPYENGLLSVTIISEKSVDGDALSTTCFALGLEDGMKLIRSLDDGTKAVFITEDEQIHNSWE